VTTRPRGSGVVRHIDPRCERVAPARRVADAGWCPPVRTTFADHAAGMGVEYWPEEGPTAPSAPWLIGAGRGVDIRPGNVVIAQDIVPEHLDINADDPDVRARPSRWVWTEVRRWSAAPKPPIRVDTFGRFHSVSADGTTSQCCSMRRASSWVVPAEIVIGRMPAIVFGSLRTHSPAWSRIAFVVFDLPELAGDPPNGLTFRTGAPCG